MRKQNYNANLATGCLAAGGTLGILIPLSVGFIIYASLAEESVGMLFMSDAVPGVVLSLLFVFTILLIAFQITPPIGMIVFAMSSTSQDTPVKFIFKGIIPFFICIILTTYRWYWFEGHGLPPTDNSYPSNHHLFSR